MRIIAHIKNRQMNRNLWEAIHQFDSYNAYQQLYDCLNQLAVEGKIKEVTVQQYYAGESV